MGAPKGPRARLSAGKKRGRQPKDPIDEGLSVSRAETRRFIQLVVSRVAYGQFTKAKPPIAADTFAKVRDVAMLDTFFSLSDTDLRNRLGVSVEYLTDLRQNPHYPAIAKALRKAGAELGKPVTIGDLAAKVEPEVGREVYLMAMNAERDREKLAALNALADRTSPKQRRRDVEPQPVSQTLPDKLVETIQMMLKLGQQYGGPGYTVSLGSGPVIEVDASRINVPSRTALLAANVPGEDEPTEGESAG